jgi:hypothetical protein
MPRSERVLPRCAPLADGDRKLSRYEVHLPYPARRRNSRQHGESRTLRTRPPVGTYLAPNTKSHVGTQHGKRTSRNMWRKLHAGSNCGAVTNAHGDNGT